MAYSLAGLLLLTIFLLVVFLATPPLLSHARRRARVKTIDELRSLTPRRFEEAVATLLSDIGYRNVKVTGRSGDRARDISATDLTGSAVTVQCKRYVSRVGSQDIQLFIGMLQTEYRGSKGIYVTTSEFTAPARELAKDYEVQLWDGNKLADLISRTRS